MQSMTMLQLEKYFYPNIFIKADPEFKAEKKEFSGKLDVKTKLNSLSTEERKWEVSLKMKTVPQDHPIPYQFEFEVVGIFKVSPDFPEGEMEEIVRIAGSSMLYSAAREFLLIITSRGPFGGISLPTITFQKKPKRVKNDKARPKTGEGELEKVQ
jgi:preprotein translocase subunit SecB